MKKIFIINGSGGKGKDTFVEFLSKHTSVFNISSVDIVKKSAYLLGWKNSKTEKDRKFLSDLKFLSSNYNNQPYEYIKENIEKFLNNSLQKVMFIHIREPLEIDKIKKEFECQTLLIKNDKISDITSNDADKNVYDYVYDFIIDNSDNLSSLRDKTLEFYIDNIKNCK